MDFDLTRRELQVYQSIANFMAKNDGLLSPTFREIAEDVQMKSKSHVWKVVDSLVSKGWVSRRIGRARSIRITRRMAFYRVQNEGGETFFIEVA